MGIALMTYGTACSSGGTGGFRVRRAGQNEKGRSEGNLNGEPIPAEREAEESEYSANSSRFQD